MEYAKKYRWALIGFIILLVLNIATLATIWIIRPPTRLAGFGEQEQPRRVQRFLERELDLSRQQRESFRQLRENHMRETRSLVSELLDSRRAYYELLNRPDSAIGVSVKDSLVRRIGSAHARLEESTYNHFQEVRRILDEEQRRQFDSIIEQTIERRSRNRRQPGRGRGMF